MASSVNRMRKEGGYCGNVRPVEKKCGDSAGKKKIKKKEGEVSDSN